MYSNQSNQNLTPICLVAVNYFSTSLFSVAILLCFIYFSCCHDDADILQIVIVIFCPLFL